MLDPTLASFGTYILVLRRLSCASLPSQPSCWFRRLSVERNELANPPVEGQGLQAAVAKLFPQLGYPVIHEDNIQNPHMPLRIILIIPADEVSFLLPISILSLF